VRSVHNARNARRSVHSGYDGGYNAREQHAKRAQITTTHAPSAARAVAVIAVNRRAAKHLVWST
jgi:hypothetical protein